MKWIHILDEQPDSGREIIECIPFQVGIGFNIHRRSFCKGYDGTWEEFVAQQTEEGWRPNYWWVYPEDFEWPEIK